VTWCGIRSCSKANVEKTRSEWERTERTWRRRHLPRHDAKLLTKHGKAGFVNSSIFPVVTIFCTTAHLVWGNSGNTVNQVNHEVRDRNARYRYTM
jgi:hypothetical protein